MTDLSALDIIKQVVNQMWQVHRVEDSSTLVYARDNQIILTLEIRVYNGYVTFTTALYILDLIKTMLPKNYTLLAPALTLVDSERRVYFGYNHHKNRWTVSDLDNPEAIEQYYEYVKGIWQVIQ